MRSTFEANCEAQGPEPEAKLLGSLGLELDPEDFWQRATTNLQASKVRLIFVADKIPAELRRIVEFLNKQMNPAEVLAVEIKQHVAEGQEEKAFVPRLIGRTADAERIKLGGTRSSRQWDETSFFEELEAKAPEAVKPARAILKWAENRVNRVAWGKGPKYGTFNAMLDHQGSAHRLLEVWTDGYLYIQLGDPQAYTLLGEESKRSELLLRLDEVPGISISDQASKKWASILLTPLNGEAALAQFLKVLHWYVEEVKAT